ncbi:hypothetical protein [Psychroserpens algicola]|uniref:hypothetical protein n=1 Tax=Psychroserpens algicola TaxID=1719034 RepID=UPI001952E534|nr:hypothetical protein [Psychroserpens algicola]
MSKETNPPKIAGVYKASKLSYMVKPAIMKNFQALTLQNNATQMLNEAPISDKIYSYNKKNYGQPQFELLPNAIENGGLPGQKGFQFTKDNEGILHLNIIVKAFHPQSNVIPLDFRTVQIELQYKSDESLKTLPLEVIQMLPVQKPNELKHIYAHTIIKDEDKEQIYEALVTPSTASKLVVKADVWWQKPASNPPKPNPPNPRIQPKPPRRRPQVQDTCTAFDASKLIVVQNRILISGKKKTGMMALFGAKPFMNFATNQDAKKALNIIKHYKLDRRCSVGKTFSYFLSGNNPPVGKLKGEDALAFNTSKLQVKYISKRWKIVEGNRSLFDFGIDKNSAHKAFNIIKKHGFDTTCYVGRPNPEMVYLKRTKPIRLQMFHAVLQPRLLDLAIKPERTQASKPQKVIITSELNLLYDREDASVFQGFFDELESKEYKWQQENKIENGDISHSYYYRLTNDPNKVFFLPQVYRIGVNHDTGEPKLYLNLYEHVDDDGSKEYRINMTIYMEPYFHPRAKKDLMGDLSELSKGNIKYVENYVLGGYQNVSFNVEERFLSDKALFSQRITETLAEINPSGFTITADHSLESFEAFKHELLTNGIDIGKIYFELEEETQDGLVVKKSRPINVELNFKKLKNIPITVDKIEDFHQQGNVPSGFYLKNDTTIEVNVEGVELTMLSKNGNFIYDADYDLGTTGIDWPLSLKAGDKQGVFINPLDIDELSVENMVWNSLVCEPHGMRADISPEIIMASVIDRATGDSEMWHLNITSPLYENWDSWSEEEKDPFKKIIGVLVEIRRDDGEIIGSYELNRANPRHLVEMSSTVQQMLQNSNHDNRKYQYRQTNITLQPSIPGEWKSSESTGVEHLYIYPQV